MNLKACITIILLGVGLNNNLPAAKAERTIWARHAVTITDCYASAHSQIPSPNGSSIVEPACRLSKNKDESLILYFRVKTPSGRWHKINADEGAHEILWSPDSQAFLVNGGTSGYAGFFVTVYLVHPDAVAKVSVTKAAQRDMVKMFPPCRADKRDETICRAMEMHPDFNMSGLAWIGNSSTIVVIAEVPCTSSYGGIMCQIEGYQLAVPSGSIEKRMSARKLKARWQRSMAWKMRIPEPPEYGATSRNP